ncbi:MAG TPA: radical SAM protein, partial [Thermodesulfobacteriota bacterium]|nr:radical SAM protein [Thermodesulfobacteriota bacterium]
MAALDNKTVCCSASAAADYARGMRAGLPSPEGEASGRLRDILARAESSEPIGREDALVLSGLGREEVPFLLHTASLLRDRGKGKTLTFSRNVFVPLTQLCRNRCGYCTFKYEPGEGPLFLTPGEVIEMARKGAELGCTELLFVTGDKPELMYP